MLGIIGGTGFYQLPGVSVSSEEVVETPFGSPSAPLVLGALGRLTVAFLPRHGGSHGLLPSEINYRANIFALKSVGVTHVVSVSAVGSLREELAPGHVVIPSQYIDMTKGLRAPSFFGNGLVGHAATAQPVCVSFLEHVASALAQSSDLVVHTNKVYACVEGPRLGTRAESFMLRGIGGEIVGMTNVPEVFLAREAQLSYASLCIVTDYDSWLEDESQHVSVEAVMAQYKKGIDKVQQGVRSLCEVALPLRSALVTGSLSGSLITPLEKMTAEQRQIVTVLGN